MVLHDSMLNWDVLKNLFMSDLMLKLNFCNRWKTNTYVQEDDSCSVFNRCSYIFSDLTVYYWKCEGQTMWAWNLTCHFLPHKNPNLHVLHSSQLFKYQRPSLSMSLCLWLVWLGIMYECTVLQNCSQKFEFSLLLSLLHRLPVLFYALGFKLMLLSRAPYNQHNNRTSFCFYFAKFTAKQLKVAQFPWQYFSLKYSHDLRLIF